MTTTETLRPPIARLIAVVGCDGTGKSTLTHDIVRTLKQTRSVQRRYLGLISGETGDKIKRLPLIGPRLERRLAAKAASAQDMRNKVPGVLGSLGYDTRMVQNGDPRFDNQGTFAQKAGFVAIESASDIARSLGHAERVGH